MRTLQGFAPVGPVRAHLVQLRTAGMSLARIAALARVPAPVVETIAAGLPMARQRIHAETAHRLLGVHPGRFLAGDSRLVDATGTRRRLQALTATGWSPTALAARAGLHPATITNLLNAGRCKTHAAHAIQHLYDLVWDDTPPTTTKAEHDAIDRALAEARQHRWAPPMAWNDDELDDPTSRPHGALRARVTAVERLDELVHLFDLGIGVDAAARRAGYARPEHARTSAMKHGHRRAIAALDRASERAA